MYEFTTNTAVAISAKPPTVPMPQSRPEPATALRECRCIDCRHWDDALGTCGELGLRRYVSRDQYHPAMRRFWTDLGMIDPAAMHYCSCYQGPQVSKDVWVWPKKEPGVGQRNEAQAPDEVVQFRNSTTTQHYRPAPAATPPSRSHQARHVGPGSTIAREAEQGYDHASVRHEHQGGQDG